MEQTQQRQEAEKNKPKPRPQRGKNSSRGPQRARGAAHMAKAAEKRMPQNLPVPETEIVKTPYDQTTTAIDTPETQNALQIETTDVPNTAEPSSAQPQVEIIGVRFKSVGKVYYFDPAGTNFACGDKVIVETARGVEIGEVALENRQVPLSKIIPPLKSIIRPASAADLRRVEDNKKKEAEAFSVCLKKIEEHKLKMKLIDAEYTFDNNKLLFYFTAESRVDFRELVKDLAGIFRTRIELRQIGVRDEAKLLGGLSICGRPFCCGSFLGEFQPVSIKMAKEQGLSLNPTKISGSCGRLMCCLKYEQDAYEDLLSMTPKVDALVTTPEGRGTVVEVNLLTGMLKVRLEKKSESPPASFHRDQVEIIQDAEIRMSRSEMNALKSLEEK